MNEKVLNPDIVTIQYGKKEIKELTVYPLSARDQFKVIDLVVAIFKSVAAGREASSTDVDFVKQGLIIVQENLSKILTIASEISSEEAEAVLDTITNKQLMNIVEIIWTVNYEDVLKNGQNLFDRMRKLSPSERLPLTSSNGTSSTV